MSASRYRILVVDDDPALLRLLSMRLSAVGYEVAAVGCTNARSRREHNFATDTLPVLSTSKTLSIEIKL